MKVIPILSIFAFALNPAESFSAQQAPKGTHRSQVLGEWRISAPEAGDQTFSLYEETFDGKPIYSVSFSRGERELRNSVIEKEKWMKWRDHWIQIAAIPMSKPICTRPVILAVRKPDVTQKEKVICIEEISSKKQVFLKTLLSEMEHFLYGR